MKVLNMLPVLMSLTFGVTSAMAAADFVTIQRSQTNMNDNTPRVLVNFNLPATVALSASTANSAVLDLDVLGAEFGYNEVYINPPTNVCNPDFADGNQPASLGFVREHDDLNLKSEWATNHIAFSSALLLAGANQLMICVRNDLGDVGPGAGNLDNVSVRSVVLHYHRNP